MLVPCELCKNGVTSLNFAVKTFRMRHHLPECEMCHDKKVVEVPDMKVEDKKVDDKKVDKK